MKTVKIVVIGAGAAGLACAISAATHGAQVWLVEKSPRLGGTVTHSLIHTIAGLYNHAGDFLNSGLPVALAERLFQADPYTSKRQMGKLWTLSVDPAVYEAVIEEWVGSLPNITLLRESCPTRVDVQGNRIQQIEIENHQRKISQQADIFVDATGTAQFVRMVNPDRVAEGEALAGLIFHIRGAASGALQFPKNIGLRRELNQAVDKGTLPAAFAHTWFDVGVYADEVYAKLNLPVPAYNPAGLALLQSQLMAFLHGSPDFAGAAVARVGHLGVRDGGRIRGEYTLTVEDVKSGRRFADSVGRCAWPIEYWDPQKGVTLDFLPPDQFYEIPLRSLRVAGMDNLWAAGKCLSAEKLAQASARVAGTCWAMGDGLGKAVAKSRPAID